MPEMRIAIAVSSSVYSYSVSYEKLIYKSPAMIEVFKTDVKEPHHASILIGRIHEAFAHYRANFDLQDCDHILRVKSVDGMVQSRSLIKLLKHSGFHAEVLPDIAMPQEAAIVCS